jgi:hypothetical protein
MKLRLYSQFETEIVSDAGDILRLPPDYTEFEVECSLIKETDAPDVVQVDKTVLLDGTAWLCRTHVSSLDFLQCLAAANPCFSTAVLEAAPGPKPKDLECLLAGAHIWCDDRDSTYFCFQRARGAKPLLYHLRRKYYSAYLDLFIHRRKDSRLGAIYARFQSRVFLNAVGQPDEIGPEDFLWFEVPEPVLLWSNSLALAQEDGRQFWCNTRRPLLPRFRKIPIGPSPNT